jgi:hypothetical protein
VSSSSLPQALKLAAMTTHAPARTARRRMVVFMGLVLLELIRVMNGALRVQRWTTANS